MTKIYKPFYNSILGFTLFAASAYTSSPKAQKASLSFTKASNSRRRKTGEWGHSQGSLPLFQTSHEPVTHTGPLCQLDLRTKDHSETYFMSLLTFQALFLGIAGQQL